MALTKASAEALSVFLNGHGLACLALHSGVKPIERLRYLDGGASRQAGAMLRQAFMEAAGDK